MTPARARSAVLALFTAVALLMTWPLAAHLDEAVPSDLGDPMLGAWILGWDADRLRHLFQGLWDAPIFFPYSHTLAFSEHLLGIAIPVAPLVWLAGTPIVAYNIAFIASFVLAAFGMSLLVEELTGRRDAGLLAGLIFGFSPSRFAQISHLQVLMSGWMPLALWMLHRYLDARSRAALAAFAVIFIIQGYSNGYYIYFLALAAAIVIAAAVATEATRRVQTLRSVAIAAAAIAVALLPIAWMYFDVRQAYGLQRTDQDVTTFGADLAAYFHGSEAVSPRLGLWRWLPYVAKPLGPEGELFPGLIAFTLACAAWWPARRGEGGSRNSARVRSTYFVLALVSVLLSLGVQATAWGRSLPIGWVYQWLFEHLPGFDGLRVPARLSVVALLAIATLAGMGFARITEAVTPRRRMAACALLGAVICFEGAPRALPLADVKPHGRPDRAAYTWVRDQEAGAVLELPAGALDARSRAAQYGYQTLFHRHRVVNGFGGYDSPLQTFIGGVGSPLLDIERFGEAVRMIRLIGVRTIVFRADGYADPSVADATLAALRADRAQVVSEATFPGVTVFRLAPAPSDTVATVGEAMLVKTGEFQATASHATDLLPRAFDGDPDTRWLTGLHQSGDEWIEIAFAQPRNVARVTILTTTRSLGDYPRELLVEGSDGSDTFAPLFRGSVVVALGEGLARDPRHGPIDIRLPANTTRRLRLRQLGSTRTWFWAVDELQMWARR